MELLKRWGPVIGSIVLIASVVLRFMGQQEVAATFEGLANATGLSAQSPVSMPELVAAATTFVGVVLKVWSQIKKATSEPVIRR